MEVKINKKDKPRIVSASITPDAPPAPTVNGLEHPEPKFVMNEEQLAPIRQHIFEESSSLLSQREQVKVRQRRLQEEATLLDQTVQQLEGAHRELEAMAVNFGINVTKLRIEGLPSPKGEEEATEENTNPDNADLDDTSSETDNKTE